MKTIFKDGDYARVRFARSICDKENAERALSRINADIIEKPDISDVLFYIKNASWISKSSVVSINQIESHHKLYGEYANIYSQLLCIHGIWHPARLFDIAEPTKKRKLQFGQ